MEKKRNKGGKWRVALILILFLAITAAAVSGGFGGSVNSCTRIWYSENEGQNSWSGKYMYLNGTMKKQIQVLGEHLEITVETKSGSLSVKITDRGGTVIFERDDIGTETFSVEASGKVTVQIEAEKHRGSISLNGGSF